MADATDLEDLRRGTDLIKRGFAKMQKGGVIMDVTDADQAGIAEDSGAVAVMALEKVPADIRDKGGVARMADPAKIERIIDAVTIPVMAKCRIGHTTEAEILETLGVDMIDESEVLTPADPFHHVDKGPFDVPFVCGARDLGEALRRIHEGAAMIRTKGEAGTGNVVEAVRHRKEIRRSIRHLKEQDAGELRDVAKEIGAPVELVEEVRDRQRLPVVDFAAGGIATPADAALMMRLGSDGIFVGSGIFKASDDPENQRARATAIVEATHRFDEPGIVAKVSAGLGEAMSGLDMDDLDESDRMQDRGW